MKILYALVYLAITASSISTVSFYLKTESEKKESNQKLKLLREIKENNIDIISDLNIVKNKIKEKRLNKIDSVILLNYIQTIDKKKLTTIEYEPILRQIQTSIDSIDMIKFGKTNAQLRNSDFTPADAIISYGVPERFNNYKLLEYVKRHLAKSTVTYENPGPYKILNITGKLFDVKPNPYNAGILISFYIIE